MGTAPDKIIARVRDAGELIGPRGGIFGELINFRGSRWPLYTPAGVLLAPGGRLQEAKHSRLTGFSFYATSSHVVEHGSGDPSNGSKLPGSATG